MNPPNPYITFKLTWMQPQKNVLATSVPNREMGWL